jgi:hypothetical protein
MRVAVCVSGACRGSLIRNGERLRAKFRGADFYYATWDRYRADFKEAFPREMCEFWAEPVAHYHPYLDVLSHPSDWYRRTTDWIRSGGHARVEWSSHHTKQILAHAWLADRIRCDYDVIVRTRFDAFVSSKANFAPYLEDTYMNRRANCFGTTRPERFDELFEVEMTAESLHRWWMLDHIIIHNADAIDRAEVDALFKERKLYAAEYGWHQVIAKGAQHRNHSGWVNPDHAVLPKFLAA